jgi:hypothetical protein
MLNINRRIPEDGNALIENIVSKLVGDTSTLDISDDCNEYIELALCQNKIKTIQKIEKIIDDANRENVNNLLFFKKFYLKIINSINENSSKNSTAVCSIFQEYVHSYDFYALQHEETYESIMLIYPYIKWTIDILTQKLFKLGYQIKFFHKCKCIYDSSLPTRLCGLSITIE